MAYFDEELHYLEQQFSYGVINLFCTNCGSEQKESAKFCHACGKPISEAVESQQAETSFEPATETGIPNSAVSVTKLDEVKPPEIAMAWSLFLSPVIGSIFWTKNWIRLGRPQHIWWTWVSAVLVFVVSIFSIDWFGNQFVGYILYLAWVGCLYAIQRRMIPKERYSKPARILSGLLAVLLIASGFLYSAPNNGNGMGEAASVNIGTSYNKNSPDLEVSGSDFGAGQVLYARVYSPNKFGKTAIKMMVESQEGAGWKTLLSDDMPVSPDYQILVAHFQVPEAGSYRISFINGNNTIADETIQVHN